MRSMGSETCDSLSTLGEDRSRRGSAQSNTTVLSPPPTRTSPKFGANNLHLRLRSDSGLALHTNRAALRQYTDYTSNGSPRSSDTHERPPSYDAACAVYTISLGKTGRSSRSLQIQE